jgi:hypothetical protein
VEQSKPLEGAATTPASPAPSPGTTGPDADPVSIAAGKIKAGKDDTGIKRRPNHPERVVQEESKPEQPAGTAHLPQELARAKNLITSTAGKDRIAGAMVTMSLAQLVGLTSDENFKVFENATKELLQGRVPTASINHIMSPYGIRTYDTLRVTNTTMNPPAPLTSDEWQHAASHTFTMHKCTMPAVTGHVSASGRGDPALHRTLYFDGGCEPMACFDKQAYFRDQQLVGGTVLTLARPLQVSLYAAGQCTEAQQVVMGASLYIEGRCFKVNALLIDNAAYEYLLGAPFQAMYDVTVMFRYNTVRLGDPAKSTYFAVRMHHQFTKRNWPAFPSHVDV